MSLFSREKRKNDSPRPLPWLMLVIGFVMGALFILMLYAGGPHKPAVLQAETTAAAKDALVTRNAPVIDPDRLAYQFATPVYDSFELTATYIVGEATTAANTQTGS